MRSGESSMNERIQNVTSELQKVADDARKAFGNLSTEQINWKPSAESWSVGQCFDHLITVNSLYFPLFERLEKGLFSPSVWEKYSPLSGFFGRFLIKSLSPENQKKMKTTAKAMPSNSEIDGRIIDLFGDHQKELIGRLQKIPGDVDSSKTIITSPLAKFVTYSLRDTFTIITVHERRHFGQAKRVTDTEGFPSAVPTGALSQAN